MDQADRVPDEHVVSASTLDELADSMVPLTARQVDWILRSELSAVPEVDDRTATTLQALGSISDTPSDGALAGIPRSVVADLCRRSGRAGYLLTRVLLGTHEQAVRWPAGDDAFARIGDMELLFGFPRLWGEVTIDAIGGIVDGSGYDDPSPDEPLGYATAMAFDQAVAVALIEHDRALGRTPG